MSDLPTTLGPSAGAARTGYGRGEDGYRRITAALFAAGMTTFVSLYAAQAVLPSLADEFAVSPARSALAVSATTGAMAVAIIPASVLSERFGRVRVMAASSLAAVVLGLVLAWAPGLGWLLALRALQGVALAGVPATAMAYLAEEVDGTSIGAAMGRYIAGTTIGGLAGRVLASFAVDLTSWRWALESAAVVSLVFTVVFLRTAPASRAFVAHPVGVRQTARNVADHLRRPALLGLFTLAFLLMGGFVSAYNILGFRLLARPFDLPEAVVGLTFLLYLAGTVSSAAAGRAADRHGRRRVLIAAIGLSVCGLALTLPDVLALVLLGMLLFTAGFFAAHAVASGWVGRLATTHRAEASSTYMFAYYLGSSVAGAAVGLAWTAAGWAGSVVFVGTLFLGALVIGWRLRSDRTEGPATMSPSHSVTPATRREGERR